MGLKQSPFTDIPGEICMCKNIFVSAKESRLRDYSTQAGHRNEKGLLMQARQFLIMGSTSFHVQVEITRFSTWGKERE